MNALIVFNAARRSAVRVRPGGAGRPALEPGRARPRPFRHRRPKRPDVGEDETIRPEEPPGERRRLGFGEHVHDLDDCDHGAVHQIRGRCHVRVIPQSAEGGAIELAAGVN